MIGVFGGTFDPIHFGHLRPILDCLQTLPLQEVRFVPLSQAVHRATPIASSKQRLTMLQIALAGQIGLTIDPRELIRGGPSYMYDTLTSLRAELDTQCPLALLLGSDAFASFHAWHRPTDILDLAHLIIMARPGDSFNQTIQKYQKYLCDKPELLTTTPGGRIFWQTVTQLEISATRIRALLKQGQSPKYLLPDAVLQLIEQENIYLTI